MESQTNSRDLCLAEVKKHEERILDALKSCARFRTECKKKGLQEFVCLDDSTQLCLVYDLDLTLLTIQMLEARSNWPKVLNARLLALTIWECVEDLPGICGKDFRATLKALTVDETLLFRLNGVMKEMSTFKKANEPALKEIRTVAAAHRDLNMDVLLDVITRTNANDLFQLSMELTKMLGAFSALMVDVYGDAKKVLRERGDGH